jgi:hypothetical protein
MKYPKNYASLILILIRCGGWDSRDRDRMVVGFTTVCAISAYHY